jgi:phospholipid-binding lipoprotein MlaA
MLITYLQTYQRLSINHGKFFMLRKLTLLTISLLMQFTSVLAFAADPNDPYESFNRHAFKLNQGLDNAIFKPVATVYQTVLPWPVTKGVSNFFSNLGEIPTVINDVLQAKFYQATSDSWRFAINSTAGLLGFIDVASKTGLEKHTQDFGLTLATWGYKKSSYLVLPLFGPSTVRDGIAFPINQGYFTVLPYIYPIATRNSLYALNFVNTRAQLLEVDKFINQAAFDRYSFERNAYLQRRQYQQRENATTRRGDTNLMMQ